MSLAPSDPAAAGGITQDELRLAARNHGQPLEALRYDVTPVGLHYLLIHFDIPAVDAGSWRLELGGRVARPLSLTLDELRARPKVTRTVTMECAGNGRALLEPRPVSQPWLTEAVGTGSWTGTPLRGLLEEAGVMEDAVDVLFTGLDRGVQGDVEQSYERSIAVAEAMAEEPLLAYELNGQPLPPQHGFPLRLVVPGWYGMTNVKWLARITVLDEQFAGFQHTHSYRLRQDEEDEGVPVTRMMPRALMVPPGIPDFLTRRRLVEPGTHLLEGRAWSGWAPIERVEVSLDGGATWVTAELGEQPAANAWQRWTLEWVAGAPGDYELCCRARDAAGNEQPTGQPWNLEGFANNAVQRVPVTVS